MRATRTRTGVVGARAGAVNAKVYYAGAAEMRAALRRLEQGMRDELLVEATQAAGDVLAEAWRANVPVEEGNYRAAIEAKAKAGSRGATGIVRVGNAPGVKRQDQPRRYAARLEFGSSSFAASDAPYDATYNLDPSKFSAGRRKGTRRRAAQPSLRPAFDSSRDRMVDAMGDVLLRLIERAT